MMTTKRSAAVVATIAVTIIIHAVITIVATMVTIMSVIAIGGIVNGIVTVISAGRTTIGSHVSAITTTIESAGMDRHIKKT